MKANKRSGPFTHEDKEPTLKFKSQDKDTTIQKQFDIVRIAFSGSPKTMLSVAVETSIERANVCRYISKLRQEGRIFLVKKGLCPITLHRAGFYQVGRD